ncbi:LysE family translocator [Shewanella sp. VB17]|uniref:LysE family translocator n=1 Tax=Shewanella sp. VB17 TaxID=2739432 RepID=UPI001562F36E|nr:LysE family translocator [Shewanella sp. VB17]NRD74223.1 LysE family translocator [Shewanella sp. VB17]
MLFSFIAATVLITLIPGPSMLMVILRALQQNFAQAAAATLGVVTADAILLSITMMGLGPLLSSSELVFEWVKWLGVIYLIYLGWQQLASQDKVLSKKHSNERNAFTQAFIITMLNPKIIGFFIAFFPQFIVAKEPLLPQLAILGPIFLVIVAMILLCYAGLAHIIAPMLRSDKLNLWVNRSAGLSLIGCGLLASTLGYQG